MDEAFLTDKRTRRDISIAWAEMLLGLLPATLWFVVSSAGVPFALRGIGLWLFNGGEMPSIFLWPLTLWIGGALGLVAGWIVLVARVTSQQVRRPTWVLGGLLAGCLTSLALGPKVASTDGLLAAYALLAPVVVALHQGALIIADHRTRDG